MEIVNQLTKVQESDTYREWKAGTPQAFLSTLFVFIDGDAQNWQAGFYDPETERTTTFVIGEQIALIPPAPTFKEPGGAVRALNIDEVAFDLAECLAIASERQRKEYASALPQKTIVILQNLPIGQVYNVTYVTAALSTLNIKVDAATKEIKQAKLIPIISFAKK